MLSYLLINKTQTFSTDIFINFFNFYNCYSNNLGGAIYSLKNLNLQNSIFLNNYANSHGGDIYIGLFSTLIIYKTCFLEFSNPSSHAGKSLFLESSISSFLDMNLNTIHSSKFNDGYDSLFFMNDQQIINSINFSKNNNNNRGIIDFYSKINCTFKFLNIISNISPSSLFEYISSSNVLIQNSNLINNTFINFFIFINNKYIYNFIFINNIVYLGLSIDYLINCKYNYPIHLISNINTFKCENFKINYNKNKKKIFLFKFLNFFYFL